MLDRNLTKSEIAFCGELLTANYLHRRKFVLLEANWRCRFGEIDLIAVKDGVLHFIEVKTRSLYSCREFSPLNAVNHNKQDRIRKLATIYKDFNRRLLKQLRVRSSSFDVSAVIFNQNTPLFRSNFNIELLMQVFS